MKIINSRDLLVTASNFLPRKFIITFDGKKYVIFTNRLKKILTQKNVSDMSPQYSCMEFFQFQTHGV